MLDTPSMRIPSGDYEMEDTDAYRSRTSALPPRQLVAPPPQVASLPSTGQSASATPTRTIPWLNPTAFPAEILNRFKCLADNPNRVFRIDLTPVFADKTTRLYQPEIDFFFR
jgi:hypothetical protein